MEAAVRIEMLFATMDPKYPLIDKPEELVSQPGAYRFGEGGNVAYFTTREEALREAEERIAIRRMGWEKAFAVERKARLDFQRALILIATNTGFPDLARSIAGDAVRLEEKLFRLPPEPVEEAKGEAVTEAPAVTGGAAS